MAATSTLALVTSKKVLRHFDQFGLLTNSSRKRKISKLAALDPPPPVCGVFEVNLNLLEVSLPRPVLLIQFKLALKNHINWGTFQ